MGYYLNPPEDVPASGRALSDPISFENYRSQLKPGEVLVGLFDRRIFKNAPWLFDKSEFDGFVDQVKTGHLSVIGFYAVPIEAANRMGACIPATGVAA